MTRFDISSWNFEESLINERQRVSSVHRFPTHYISKSLGINAVVGQEAICESRRKGWQGFRVQNDGIASILHP